MNDPTLPLLGLSPVSGKKVIPKFDVGLLSSDAGVLLLREVEQKLRIAERLAGCLHDPRNPALVTHPLSNLVRFRLLMIAAGYEDGNDAEESVVDVEDDPFRDLAERGAVKVCHGAPHPQQCAKVREILHTRDCRL